MQERNAFGERGGAGGVEQAGDIFGHHLRGCRREFGVCDAGRAMQEIRVNHLARRGEVIQRNDLFQLR